MTERNINPNFERDGIWMPPPGGYGTMREQDEARLADAKAKYGEGSSPWHTAKAARDLGILLQREIDREAK